jgi:metallophosphoesterase (TIGR00282 family)
MRILIIGDIVGRPGRQAVRHLAPPLRQELQFDILIANAENAAGGKGVTCETLHELFNAGVDVVTTGDHAFDQKTALEALADPRVVRPCNYPPGTPGRGMAVVSAANGVRVGVINLLGRVFMKPIDCPFRAADAAVRRLAEQASVIIVDMHAEATSEKIALGWHLDGTVAAVCGTHTHVQTADEGVLPRGTAYITDLGMTGSHASVLGRDVQAVVGHFRTGLPHRFSLATDDVRLHGALIEVDQQTGMAVAIERVQRGLQAQ